MKLVAAMPMEDDLISVTTTDAEGRTRARLYEPVEDTDRDIPLAELEGWKRTIRACGGLVWQRGRGR
jgi:hypothetical protein